MTTTYKDADEDIDAGERLVEQIKPLAGRVRIPELMGNLGRCAGLCEEHDGTTLRARSQFDLDEPGSSRPVHIVGREIVGQIG